MDYIVAAIGDWNRKLFDENIPSLKGHWYFSSSPEDLNFLLASGVQPRFIFFPHWRWIVPVNLINRYECVCFHMTDLPYGRGGSPLQNLIVRGHKETMLTALQMEAGLDTGPVYFKEHLSLKGTAADIYERASRLTWKIIAELIANEPRPIPQDGKPTLFKRRVPEQSLIPPNLSLEKIYDYIRMLDAPGYPKAFLEIGDYLLEFTGADLLEDEVLAKVRIKIKEKQ